MVFERCYFLLNATPYKDQLYFWTPNKKNLDSTSGMLPDFAGKTPSPVQPGPGLYSLVLFHHEYSQFTSLPSYPLTYLHNLCHSPKSKGEGNGTRLQYSSCLENPMDRGAWWAAVQGVTKSQTWLSDFTFPFHFHALEKEMATHSSVLAWRIPGTGEPGGPPSMGSHRVGHNWSDLAAAAQI